MVRYYLFRSWSTCLINCIAWVFEESWITESSCEDPHGTTRLCFKVSFHSPIQNTLKQNHNGTFPIYRWTTGGSKINVVVQKRSTAGSYYLVRIKRNNAQQFFPCYRLSRLANFLVASWKFEAKGNVFIKRIEPWTTLLILTIQCIAVCLLKQREILENSVIYFCQLLLITAAHKVHVTTDGWRTTPSCTSMLQILMVNENWLWRDGDAFQLHSFRDHTHLLGWHVSTVMVTVQNQQIPSLSSSYDWIVTLSSVPPY